MDIESRTKFGDATLASVKNVTAEMTGADLAQELILTERSTMPHYVAHLQGVLHEIKADERYLKNIEYGRARRGHPEGKVAAHIRELEGNLKQIQEYLTLAGTPINPATVAVLEILIHVHDSFKAEAQPRVRIDDPHSHASIAREFLATKLNDSSILTMVQLHDVPWSLYQQFQKYGDFNRERLVALSKEIPSMETFQLFQIIDNTTTGKVTPGTQSSVKWFISETSPLFETKLDFYAIALFLEDSATRKLE